MVKESVSRSDVQTRGFKSHFSHFLRCRYPKKAPGTIQMNFEDPTATERLATESLNRKHKREVCRYWLQSKCLKGQACEFLHSIDYSKMPMCTRGDACQEKDCQFKHGAESRSVCANYQLGFCSFGLRCNHLHVTGAELPDVSPYWTPEYAALSRPSTGPNFRKRPCDYYTQNGWCPYFDMCNFAH